MFEDNSYTPTHADRLASQLVSRGHDLLGATVTNQLEHTLLFKLSRHAFEGSCWVVDRRIDSLLRSVLYDLR